MKGTKNKKRIIQEDSRKTSKPQSNKEEKPMKMTGKQILKETENKYKGISKRK